GNDARLTHTPGQERLANTIIDLVGPRVVEVLPLQEDAGTARFARQPLGEIKRCRPADVMVQIVVELPLKLRVLARLSVLLCQLAQGEHKGLRTVAAAIRAKAALGVGNGQGRRRHSALE